LDDPDVVLHGNRVLSGAPLTDTSAPDGAAQEGERMCLHSAYETGGVVYLHAPVPASPPMSNTRSNMTISALRGSDVVAAGGRWRAGGLGEVSEQVAQAAQE
jgi:hypothetical protein